MYAQDDDGSDDNDDAGDDDDDDDDGGDDDADGDDGIDTGYHLQGSCCACLGLGLCLMLPSLVESSRSYSRCALYERWCFKD